MDKAWSIRRKTLIINKVGLDIGKLGDGFWYEIYETKQTAWMGRVQRTMRADRGLREEEVMIVVMKTIIKYG